MQKKTKIASLVAAITLVTGGLAIGSPTAGGGIFACLSPSAGTLTKVSTKAPKCPKGTTLITWNQVGPRGPQGIAGPQGPAGTPGAPGQAGLNGLNGLDGRQGIQGPTGPEGPRGAQGIQGPRGEVGPQGSPGERGDAGVAGPRGEVGPSGPEGPKGDVGTEERFRTFARTNFGVLEVVDGHVKLNGVFWRCNDGSRCDMVPFVDFWDNDHPDLEREFTEDSYPSSLVYTTNNCTGTARAWLHGGSERYFPSVTRGFDMLFVEKRPTIAFEDINSYSIDGVCQENASPSWNRGSYLAGFVGDDLLRQDYTFYLVDIMEVDETGLGIEIYERFSEWR